MGNTLHQHHEVEGYYKFVVTNPDGTTEVLADWFPNLITNGGLDRMGVDLPLGYCQVGTGWGAEYSVTGTDITNSLLGPASLTAIYLGGTVNDSFYTITLPWTVIYNNTSYSTCYVGANSYITFGAGSTSWTGLTGSEPAYNKIGIGAADNSIQRLYAGIEGTSPTRTFRIRYEGTAAGTGTPGSPTIVWEVIFYEEDPTQFDVQVGVNNRGMTGLHGVYNSSVAKYPFLYNQNFGIRLKWVPPDTGVVAIPSETDTVLGSQIASTTSTAWTPSSQNSTEPYYIKNTIRYRFPIGSVSGDIREVGVGWYPSGGLFSRALILDGGGNPTVIPIASDQALDVYYEFRLYPTTTDSSGTVTFNGNTYSWVGRPANIDYIQTDGSRYLGQWGMTNAGLHAAMVSYLGLAGTFRISNGTLGTVTQEITSGTTINSNTGDNASSFYDPYVLGSYERSLTVALGITSYLSGYAPITAFQTNVGYGVYQFSFTPGLPKSYNDLMKIKVKISWGRRA